ncbi:MAG: FtsQ-type POTRA domain-containing protein [Ornithinimicrobium sp.]|uniref:cell division protein FtsQ/DivIB n=1 Tax=Ornithinimicrobium sp. TaxID=1977084 RepID=UPI0026DEE65E|nr:FtsQ-type POTRA domain-containing protein [Ornithinimicrobium sp.]MDO5740563.1 FtsQ-type POTRA domain-containing protein [Ornithinimicrobium sp.]
MVIWGAIVLALAAGVIFLFFFSAAFVVKDLHVADAKGELATSVEELADIPRGRPLARVSEAKINERVQADLRVARVSVERQWPSSVTLRVVQREPALVLQQGGSMWLADVDGVVFDEVGKAPGKLPVVTVPTKPTELSAATVQGLVQLWATRPKANVLGGKLSTPALSRTGSVTMRVGQVTIVWGPPVEAEKKWKVVSALLAQDSIDPSGVIAQKIDVTLPDTPIVTGIPPATG